MKGKILMVGIIALAMGTASTMHFGNQQILINTQLTNYRSQVSGQGRSIQALDAEINAYWTAIRKANAANGIPLPDSPEAYSQNPLPATTGLESAVNTGLIGAIEAKAESTKYLAELNQHIQQESTRYDAENNKKLLGVLAMVIGIPIVTYSLTRRTKKEQREKELSHSPV